VVFVEIVKELLNAVISPRVSGNESVQYVRAIAYAILLGLLSAVATGMAKKYAKVLPREISGLLENVAKEGPFMELLRSVVAQVRPRLEVEIGREAAERAIKIIEEAVVQAATQTPADILPAEERMKYFKIGRDMGIIALAFDSVPGPSPSKI
jgi:hypothetical protein